jgi:hypothetical protein
MQGERGLARRFRSKDLDDISSWMQPVLMVGMSRVSWLPRVMMEPLPWFFSICATAASSALFLLETSSETGGVVFLADIMDSF